MTSNIRFILIVEDHPIFLEAMVDLLSQRFPEAKIETARSAHEVDQQLSQIVPDLLVFDLAIPRSHQEPEKAQAGTGVQLLKQVMRRYPETHIAVHSTDFKPLIRIRAEIDEHQAGFTIISKQCPSQEAIEHIESAVKGYTNTQELRVNFPGTEIKPEWWQVLRLAFGQGLQDKLIAQQMKVQPGTVRHYWSKLYDVLGLEPEAERKAGRNLRTMAEIRAREKGLID